MRNFERRREHVTLHDKVAKNVSVIGKEYKQYTGGSLKHFHYSEEEKDTKKSHFKDLKPVVVRP